MIQTISSDVIVVITYLQNCEIGPWLMNTDRPIRYAEWTRNSSGDEIAKVNFFTTISSTTFMQCAPEATEFGEIMQNKAVVLC